MFLQSYGYFSVAKAPPAFVASNVTVSSKFAIVSLLYGKSSLRNYTLYAIKLAKSIKRVMNIEMVLMVSETSDTEAAANAGWKIKPVHRIRCRRDMGKEAFYTKLRAWSLVEYEAVLFMDLDTVMLKEVSSLFTYWVPKLMMRNALFGAAMERPQVWSPRYNKAGHVFNTGVMLLFPDHSVLGWMLRALDYMPGDNFLNKKGDQDFLNTALSAKWMELPTMYNTIAFVPYAEPSVWNEVFQTVSIIHYTWPKPDDDYSCKYLQVMALCQLWREIV